MSLASPPRPVPATMAPLDWATLAVLSLLWAGSFFFVGIAVVDLPALTIVTLRVSLAAVILWWVVVRRGLLVPLSQEILLAFAGMGLLNNAIPFTLIVWGQHHIASGLASILNATTPLFTILVAGVLLTDERINAPKLAGTVIGFLGVAMMLGVDALAGLGSDLLPQLAVLAAALSYAFAGVYGRRFHRLGVPPTVVAAGQVTASTLWLLPLTMAIDRPWELTNPTLATWMAVVALAAFSTALAYILYFRLLARAGATNLLLVTLLIPPTAILLGVAVLGERLGGSEVLGMVLIGAGLICVDGRVFRRRLSKVA